MKKWKGKIVRRKNHKKDSAEEDIVGIVLTNPREHRVSFTSKAVALTLVVDVMWGDIIEYCVSIDALIICKS